VIPELTKVEKRHPGITLVLRKEIISISENWRANWGQPLNRLLIYGGIIVRTQKSLAGGYRQDEAMTYKNKRKTKESFLIREARWFYNRLHSTQYF
jgi:hypothetical protein